MKHDYVHSMEA